MNRFEDPGQEHASDGACDLEGHLLGRGQTVDAPGDDALDGLRQSQSVEIRDVCRELAAPCFDSKMAGFSKRETELLAEEWIAAGARGDEALGGRRNLFDAEPMGGQSRELTALHAFQIPFVSRLARTQTLPFAGLLRHRAAGHHEQECRNRSRDSFEQGP